MYHEILAHYLLVPTLFSAFSKSKNLFNLRILDKIIKFHSVHYKSINAEGQKITLELQKLIEEIFAHFEVKVDAISEKISEKSVAHKLLLLFKVLAALGSKFNDLDVLIKTQLQPLIEKAIGRPIEAYIKLFVRLLT